MDTLKPTKRCWVCGDKGTGFNYEALSCESCKVFFHRNASRPDRLKCRKENNCEIDWASRKSCTKCRLDKCFTVGMKWKNAEDEEVKKRKIQSLMGNVDTIRTILESDLIIDGKVFTPTDASSLFQSPTIVRKKKYAADLTVLERKLIGEVQSAMMVAFEDESKLPLMGEVRDITNFINLPVHYIKRMVKFCKGLEAFKVLDEEDKLAILKHFFVELLSVRFTYNFDFEKDGHAILENESGTRALFITFEACASMHKDPEKLKFNREYCRTFKLCMEQDQTIRDLIIAQFLFKPRKNLICDEYVRYQYYIYCRLLRRYLEHKYKSVNQANRKYSALMRFVDQMDDLIRENIQKMFDEIDVAQMAQILVEIYDAKRVN